MTYIAKKTVKYHVKPGVVFGLVEGKEVLANGFNLQELLRSGLVKKANLIDKVKKKVEDSKAKKAAAKAEEESEVAEGTDEVTISDLAPGETLAFSDGEAAPNKRGRPKKTEVAE